MFRPTRSLAALVALVAACSSPSAITTDRTEGTYLLERVNGLALPYPMVDDGSVRVDVVSRTVRLLPNGSFEDLLELRVADATDVSPLVTRRQGSWSHEGDRVVLSYAASGRTSTGRIAGPVLDLDDRGLSFLLHR